MTIHEALETRRNRAINWMIASGLLVLMTFVVGLGRGDAYSHAVNNFFTVVMIACFALAIVTGIIDAFLWRSYENVRRDIIGKNQKSSRVGSS